MKTLKNHKTLKAIRRGCAGQGINVELIKRKGSGSHRGVAFSRDGARRGVVIVIAGGDEISPGVQRRVLDDLLRRSEKNPLAGDVHRILERIFRSGGR
ncbi:MAG: hypothetical protein IID48_15700 [Proteobacteria bacterium]|nr:hypothetical protein [Pseudomonadota bacterium]